MTKDKINEDLIALPTGKTAELDKLAKEYIKRKENVSCLKDEALEIAAYNRLYFQVNLGELKTVEEKLQFIEDNSDLLNDWWHTDQLNQFIGKIPFELAYKKAFYYVKSEETFMRRWGYVLFMNICDNKKAMAITKLLHNDDEYYVIMAEAWLIATLTAYYPEEVYKWMKNDNKLTYDIMGKAIQKICDSYRVSDDDKKKFKDLRKKYKNADEK